jgi:hypothetical protein
LGCVSNYDAFDCQLLTLNFQLFTFIIQVESTGIRLQIQSYIPFVITCVTIGALGCVVVMILEEQIRTAQTRGSGVFWSTLFAIITVVCLSISLMNYLGYFNFRFVDHMLGLPLTADLSHASGSTSSRGSWFGGFQFALLVLLLASAGKSFAWSLRSQASRTDGGLVRRYRINDHLHYRELWLVAFGALVVKVIGCTGSGSVDPDPASMLRRAVAFPVLVALFFLGNEFERLVPFGFPWQRVLTVIANLSGLALLTAVAVL